VRFDIEEQASRAIKLAPKATLKQSRSHAKFGRRRVLVFCCNIEHVDKVEGR